MIPFLNVSGIKPSPYRRIRTMVHVTKHPVTGENLEIPTFIRQKLKTFSKPTRIVE